MAINQNHLFEELDGIKCAIVEKNATTARVEFLKHLLELNNYSVVVVPSPPPKSVPPENEIKPEPSTFTIGVTDVSFNSTNAIFGRLLKTKEGRVVTLGYWQQKEKIPEDKPYFEK
jgi:hypothetical protein